MLAEKLGHLACLGGTKQSGDVWFPAQENLFLIR